MPANLNPNNPFVQLINEYGPYGYVPKLAPAVVFTVAYALLTLVHLSLTIRSRQWWLIVLAVLVVVTPVFFAAMHFAILGKVLQLFGREFSVVSPKLIIPFFVCLDVISLVIQGSGSGIAAVNEINGKNPMGGSNIVVGGLSIQLLGYVLFDILAIIFAARAWRAGPPHPPSKLWTPKVRRGLIAAFASALLVLLRSSFRTGEMAEGWIGHVATTEWYYYVFDAAPVTIAVLILAIWHPAQYLPSDIAAEARELQQANDVEGQGTAYEGGSDQGGSDRSEKSSSTFGGFTPAKTEL